MQAAGCVPSLQTRHLQARPTENDSHVCFTPSLGRRKQQLPLSSHQTGQRRSKTSCGCIQGALSRGSGSKTPTLFKNVAYFCHQALAAAPWGRAEGGGFLQEPIVNSASSDNINARCCVYVIRGFCHSCALVVFATLRESFEKRRPIETSIISLFHRRKVQRQKQTIKDEMASINQPDTF